MSITPTPEERAMAAVMTAVARSDAEFRARIAALEAQLAEARKDAERLDWLETQQDVMWQTHDGQWHGGPGNDARDMVDKARGADNSAPQEVKP